MDVMPGRLIKRGLSLVFLVAIVYFFIITLANAFRTVEEADLAPSLLTLASVICFAVAVLTSALLWRTILNTSLAGAGLGRMESVNVYVSAWLLKYLPGKAWSYGYRIMVSKSKGIGVSAVLHSFALETLCLITASTIPAVPFVFLIMITDSASTMNRHMLVLILLPLLALLYPPIWKKASDLLLRPLMRYDPGLMGKTPRTLLIKIQLGYVISRMVNGIGFVLIAQSLFDITPSMWLPLIAFYMLAGLLGSLAIFAPSGLGVREGVLVALTIHYFSLEQAALLAVVTRLYTILTDILLASIVAPSHLRKWIFE